MSPSKTSPSGDVQPILLGGEWVEGESVQEVRAPYDGALIGKTWKAGKNQTELAVEKALEGFETFRHSSTRVRRDILLKAAALIGERHDELVEVLSREAGKPVMFSALEVRRMKLTFELAAAELTRFGGEVLPVDFDDRAEHCTCVVRRFPLGVVAAIVPYNWPFNLAAHKIAPALAVGNALLVKPATATPLSTLALGRLLMDAGVPKGVLSILPCSSSLAESWVRDERVAMISFTGSPPVGWHLKSVAGKKKVSLELGGNAAMVIHEDADLDLAVKRCIIGGFGYAGQVCIAIQRILVHKPVYEKFREKFIPAVQSCPYGDPMDKNTISGPLIDEANAVRIENWIQEAIKGGAKVSAGGTRKGKLLAPTVVENVKRDMKLSCEEVFGPLVTLESYENWNEALKKVNDSQFGLQAGIFTRDSQRIQEAFLKLEVGGVIANDFPTMRVDNFPYGGVKNSGFGREGVKYAMEEMTELKTLFTRFQGGS
jgi:acyl-CoA reductase-like NAD-dependent aldehyde dehydrogenase